VYVVRKWPVGEKSFCVLEYHMSKSVVTVQHAFCAKYAKDPPTDKTVRVVINSLLKLCVCKQKSSGYPLTTEDYLNRFRPIFYIV
jgi:hypothetical protein